MCGWRWKPEASVVKAEVERLGKAWTCSPVPCGKDSRRKVAVQKGMRLWPLGLGFLVSPVGGADVPSWEAAGA